MPFSFEDFKALLVAADYEARRGTGALTTQNHKYNPNTNVVKPTTCITVYVESMGEILPIQQLSRRT